MRAWFAGLSMALFLFAASAGAETLHGALLAEGASKVGENRYVAQKDWDKTVGFYRRLYAPGTGYVWRSLPSTPQVKAVNIENLKPDRKWDGINVYETRGKVYIYVIPAAGADSKKR